MAEARHPPRGPALGVSGETAEQVADVLMHVETMLEQLERLYAGRDMPHQFKVKGWALEKQAEPVTDVGKGRCATDQCERSSAS